MLGGLPVTAQGLGAAGLGQARGLGREPVRLGWGSAEGREGATEGERPQGQAVWLWKPWQSLGLTVGAVGVCRKFLGSFFEER